MFNPNDKDLLVLLAFSLNNNRSQRQSRSLCSYTFLGATLSCGGLKHLGGATRATDWQWRARQGQLTQVANERQLMRARKPRP